MQFQTLHGSTGAEHIGHGALRHTIAAFKDYSNWRKSAQAISKMLNSKLCKDSIKSRLLSGPHLESARAAVDQGFSHIMDHRVLALQQFLDDVLVLEDVLVFSLEQQSYVCHDWW